MFVLKSQWLACTLRHVARKKKGNESRFWKGKTNEAGFKRETLNPWLTEEKELRQQTSETKKVASWEVAKAKEKSFTMTFNHSKAMEWASKEYSINAITSLNLIWELRMLTNDHDIAELWMDIFKKLLNEEFLRIKSPCFRARVVHYPQRRGSWPGT